MEGPKRIIDAS